MEREQGMPGNGSSWKSPLTVLHVLHIAATAVIMKIAFMLVSSGITGIIRGVTKTYTSGRA